MNISKLTPKDYKDGLCQDCELQSRITSLEAEKERLKKQNEELGNKINCCRHYLMQVQPDAVEISSTLVALGFSEDGL